MPHSHPDDRTPSGGVSTRDLRRLPSDDGRKTRRALYEAALDGATSLEERWRYARQAFGDILDAQDAMARSMAADGAANRTAHAKAADRDAALLQEIKAIKAAQEERDTILIRELGERARTDERHDAALTARRIASAAAGVGLVQLAEWIVRHL